MPVNIALQGDLATPAMLERDMGELARIVNYFLDSKDGASCLAEQIKKIHELHAEKINLLGYSRGAILIQDMLGHGLLPPFLVDKCVIYEGPNLSGAAVIPGFFPVMIAWNDRSKSMRRPRMRDATGRAWAWQHAPWGHNWDWGLELQIREFLAESSFSPAFV